MKTRDKIKATGMVLGITLSIFAISLGVLATDWVGPTQAPPGGNLPAPLNSSSLAQIKDGPLGIEGVLRAYSNLIVDGNVGIGTTTPEVKLHSMGQIRADIDDDATAFRIADSVGGSANINLYRDTSDSFTIDVGAAWRALVIKNDGNVGIGTTSPAEKLHVDGRIRLGLAPSNNMDATTKQYVDNAVAAAGGDRLGVWTNDGNTRLGDFVISSSPWACVGTSYATADGDVVSLGSFDCTVYPFTDNFWYTTSNCSGTAYRTYDAPTGNVRNPGHGLANIYVAGSGSARYLYSKRDINGNCSSTGTQYHYSYPWQLQATSKCGGNGICKIK